MLRYLVAFGLVLLSLLAQGCLNRQPADDLFVIDDLHWGEPLDQVAARFGDLRRPLPVEVERFQHPVYKPAAVSHDLMVGNTPYDVYFITDPMGGLEMVIMVTRSRFPLTAERESVEKQLRERLGEPVSQMPDTEAAGLRLDQMVWQGDDTTVTMVDVSRQPMAAAEEHAAVAEGQGEAEQAHGEVATHEAPAEEGHGEAAEAHGEVAEGHGEAAATHEVDRSTRGSAHSLFLVYQRGTS